MSSLPPQTIARTGSFNPDLVLESETIIAQAIQFAVINEMPPTFFEFGVWWGNTLLRTYHTWKATYDSFIASWSGEMDDDQLALAKQRVDQVRLYGFDSFEGLPPLEKADEGGFFKEAQFSAGLDLVRDNLSKNDVPAEAFVPISGWYSELGTCGLAPEHTGPASVIHVDCDLYSSTRDALGFLTDFLGDGSVVIFDDWNHYRGHPNRGERRAFREWSETLEGWSFETFRTEGAFRHSFIASKLDQD